MFNVKRVVEELLANIEMIVGTSSIHSPLDYLTEEEYMAGIWGQKLGLSREVGVNIFCFEPEGYKYILGEQLRNIDKLWKDDWKVIVPTATQSVGWVHVHDFYEITYIVKGKYDYKISDTEVTLNEGDLIIMDTNCVHSDISPLDKEVVLLYVSINRGLFSKYIFDSKLSGPVSRLSSSEIPGADDEQRCVIFHTAEEPGFYGEIENTLAMILRESSKREAHFESIVRLLTLRLLSELDSAEIAQELVFGSKMRDELVLVEIDRHIRENLRTVDIKSLCEYMHFNSTYYNRIIKKRTGMTLTAYIQKKRIDKTKNLLISTDKPINEVMEEIGYKNKQFFYKLFFKECGMTPKQYKQNYKTLFKYDPR